MIVRASGYGWCYYPQDKPYQLAYLFAQEKIVCFTLAGNDYCATDVSVTCLAFMNPVYANTIVKYLTYNTCRIFTNSLIPIELKKLSSNEF
jgi:hypothetical protein